MEPAGMALGRGRTLRERAFSSGLGEFLNTTLVLSLVGAYAWGIGFAVTVGILALAPWQSSCW